MKVCKSCGRTVEDKDGLELVDGSFYCQSGGCQARFLNGVYEEKVKPDLLAQNRAFSSSIDSGVCDVCGLPVASPDGFLLTTSQVVSSPDYWQTYYQSHQAEFVPLNVFSFADFCNNLFVRPACVKVVAGQRTPWMVCAKCISKFSVNREEASRFARQWWQDRTFQPPGAGPAAISDANLGMRVQLPNSGRPATPLDFLKPQKKWWEFWKE